MINLRDLPELVAKTLPRAFLMWLIDVLNRINAKLDVLETYVVGNFPKIKTGGELEDSNRAVPEGDVVGTTDTQTLSNKTLVTPDIDDFTNANHTHINAAGGGKLTENALSLSDVTTNDALATKHGFLPKLSDVEAEFLSGKGTWLEPNASLFSVFAAAQFDSIVVDLATVTGLSVTLEASKNYRFRAVLYVDADAVGGHKYAINGTCTPGSIIYQIDSIDNSLNAMVINSRQAALAGDASQVGATVIRTEINGFIIVVAAGGGTLAVQFAQAVANNTSSVLIGSHFIVEEMIP